MKAYEIKDSFGLNHLQLVERPSPAVPANDEVLVKLKAVSLNYRDLMTVEGHYNPDQPLPLIPCSDGVGEVEAVGEEVNDFQVGDRVIPTFFQDWIAGAPRSAMIQSTLGGPLDGTLAESIRVQARGLVRAPDHLSDVEAATLPCAALTAWNALVTHGNIKAGERVLVLGSGGVSVFALQIARIMGAEVIATSSNDEKLERLGELGASHLINYRRQAEWGDQVNRLTGGHGVDLVVEVGGAKTLKQSLKAVKRGGRISLIGVLSGAVSDLNIVPILMRSIRIQGILVGHRESFEAMNQALELNQVRPVVDQIFSFAEAPAAFRRMSEARHFGKICIRLP